MRDSAVPVADTEEVSVRRSLRYRLDLGYDGTDFAGWAKQPGLRTVQGVLEEAVDRIFGGRGAPARLVVAGRTDAGVHAARQTAHIDLELARVLALERPRRGEAAPADSAAALVRKVNGVLGPISDVVLHRGSLVPDAFDARFAASWRRYEYRVGDAHAFRDPLLRRSTARVREVLDVEAMNAACAELLGLHDFLSFCKPRTGATTIRTLQEFAWERDDNGVLRARLRADAFCHSMVRSLVGASVAVGSGRMEAAEMLSALHHPAPLRSWATMPAHGLTLVEVHYPHEAEWLSRAQRTRARRTLSGPAVEV